mgnify:CR=1 FL=1
MKYKVGDEIIFSSKGNQWTRAYSHVYRITEVLSDERKYKYITTYDSNEDYTTGFADFFRESIDKDDRYRKLTKLEKALL